MRGRTVTFTMPEGGKAQEQLTATDAYCVHCGTRGVWATIEGALVCPRCRTVMPFASAPYQAGPGSPFGQIANALAA